MNGLRCGEMGTGREMRMIHGFVPSGKVDGVWFIGSSGICPNHSPKDITAQMAMAMVLWRGQGNKTLQDEGGRITGGIPY